MSSPGSDSKTSLFRDEAPEMAEYRPLSPRAILVFFLGLGSFFAVVAPVMWILPILTVILGCGVLRANSQNLKILGGRKLVLVSLTLACFFGGLAPVRHFTRQRTLYAQSRQFAEQWFGLIRDGHLMEAHQLRMGHQERATMDSNLAEHYQMDTTKMVFDTFVQGSPVVEMTRWKERTQIRFVENTSIDPTGPNDLITQRFDLGLEHDDPKNFLRAEIFLMRRAYPVAGESRWEVQDCQVISQPAKMP